MTFRRTLALMIVTFCVASPFFAYAQTGDQSSSDSATVTPDTVIVEKAQVTATANSQTEPIPGTGTNSQSQTLTAVVLSGPDRGQKVTFTNDYIQLNIGDVFYASHTTNTLDGTDYWSVANPYRLNALLALAAIFFFLVIAFGGLQGLRGLATFLGSLLLIFFLLVPGILQGYSPVLMSIAVAGLIILVGSYITHGFNRTTTAAIFGMIATVLITGALAYYFVHAAQLSGFATEEEVYLNFDTHGTIDMVGLLFGGIMIGLLGVLYDIAIGQAIAVEELFRAGVHMTRLQVYARAIRIGREHIGALVNTLAIAYVGSALPIILLSQEGSSYGFLYTANSEIFATEIVRILIGSIGLILGVPVTTFIASYMLHGRIVPGDTSLHEGHSHSH
ncbi:MAG TPA: YibE/F family protein [Candidatus Paceibacterota bacterium]|nr:YibE/F family protein [Candidatus Paceibacterota bacterium]